MSPSSLTRVLESPNRIEYVDRLLTPYAQNKPKRICEWRHLCLKWSKQLLEAEGHTYFPKIPLLFRRGPSERQNRGMAGPCGHRPPTVDNPGGYVCIYYILYVVSDLNLKNLLLYISRGPGRRFNNILYQASSHPAISRAMSQGALMPVRLQQIIPVQTVDGKGSQAASQDVWSQERRDPGE
jgi:hypothetical protein